MTASVRGNDQSNEWEPTTVGIQESGLRKMLSEFVFIHVAVAGHQENWAGHRLKGFLITCPELDYERLWFPKDQQWSRVDYPLRSTHTIYPIRTGLSQTVVIYAVGVAIVGDILAAAVEVLRAQPFRAWEVGPYIRECEIYLHHTVRTALVGGYAHEAHQRADLELATHRTLVNSLPGYDGIFSTATTEDDGVPSELLRRPVQSRAQTTSFEQFQASIANRVARAGLGIEMSDAEGARIAGDPTLAMAYYQNWVSVRPSEARQATPSRPGVPAQPGPRRSNQRIPPHRPAAAPKPYNRGRAIVGLALGVLAYLGVGSQLTLILGLVGLIVSIPALTSARAANGRRGAHSGWVIALIGVIASGIALLLSLLMLVSITGRT